MRSAGILLPVFSLPGPYGIGTLSESAYRFVDFLRDCHQRYWQILPLGPTGYGDSPYQTFSTFAGNPYFISLEALIEEGLLTKQECAPLNRKVSPGEIDYYRLYNTRYKILKKAYKRSSPEEDAEFLSFAKENADWLDDYALFMALKDAFGGVSFKEWPEDLRVRKPSALKKAEKKYKDEIGFQKFLQYKFYSQWFRLKKYANENGIEMIGDIPIYVSPDSSDLWSHTDLFQADKGGVLKAVAGCPPDGFSADGQLWGNPLYDWPRHKETGFGWWLRRMEKCLELFDVVRIDHFRGFDQYYSIPAGNKTARGGHWEDGPGMALFDAMKKAFGKTRIIAEDLGYLTPSVRRLVKRTGFPNMKVLEFAFDAGDEMGSNEYLPHNYGSNCVVYTGTHDNETLAGWIRSINPAQRRRLFRYLDIHTRDKREIVYRIIRLALSSVADYCIIPLQDYLCLDNTARVNYPSTLGGNWVWRAEKKDFSGDLECDIRALTDMFGRYHPEKNKKR